ncbi:MAG: alpha/beta fold hydrolase [Bacilli bacterium]|nr:alpha/beta fold hydrolase [Bacilli bacterium]
MDQDTKNFIKGLAKAVIQVGKKVTPAVATAVIYKNIFGHRIETNKYLTFLMSDFKGLSRVRCSFKTNNKNTLVGYTYIYKDLKPKALIVFAHGFGGGGQTSYLDIIDHLASQGYVVFAYDATANDESTGETLRGFPQAVIDLEQAIKFARGLREFSKLPLVLFGHSMGAYSVSNVLNFYPNVKCVVAASGFNKSSEIVKQHANEFDEGQADEIIPYIDTYEEIEFGKYAKKSAVEGFKNTKANILIIHSEDDEVIPISSGLDLYKNELRNCSRMNYIRLKNSGHGEVFYTAEGKQYCKLLNTTYKKLAKQKETTPELLEQFKNSIDRDRYSRMVDVKLFEKITKFIDSSI